MICTKDYKTPFGELIIGSHEGSLVLCDWKYRRMRKAIDKRIQSKLSAKYQSGESEIINETIAQLDDYSKGNRKQFYLPLKFAGTDFQQQVWQALIKIPYGKTESYLGLSKILGDEKAIRAVATANGANAISIIVPCHRIIGSNGDLVGYAGGIAVKKKLLQLENPMFDNQLSLFS